VISMRPYWLVRTVGGISMDIGMSLLVINLMMTALTSPAREAERPAFSPAPVPASGAA
jgi:cytochrome c oxidase cbb3-type subunit 1